jgi:ADP-heptose:LPS heptosyltransferase
MEILKKVNNSRRNLMRGITRNIGGHRLNHIVKPEVPPQINRVLISRPNNRLGNLLLITPLLEEVSDTFPNCKIDLFVRGNLAPILFHNYPNINSIIGLPGKPFKFLAEYVKAWLSLRRQRYDLVINVDKDSSSGRLSTKFSNAKYKIFGDTNERIVLQHRDQDHMAKQPVYTFRDYLNDLGIMPRSKEVAPLDLKLTEPEIEEGRQVLKNLVNNDKKSIAIFTYATGTKRYSESWWKEFYERLKSEYTDYNIIEILPAENVSQIGFEAPSFYSTDIRQIASVLANTAIFIGADSGIMHLASASRTPTVALFSVTEANRYAPYNKKSVGINTNTSHANDWIESINSILLS